MWTYNREIHFASPAYRKTWHLMEAAVQESLLENFCNNNEDKRAITDAHAVDIPPYACEFSTSKRNLCLIADEEGYISFMDISDTPDNFEGKSLKIINSWQTHNNAVFDIACAHNSSKFATASGDTTAILWDMECPRQQLNVFHGHSCSLKSICINPHNTNILATGSRDGNVLIWDCRCSKSGATQAVIRIQSAHAINDALTPQRKRRRKIATKLISQLVKDSRQTVTSVIFQDSNTLISSGAMDGALKLWDLRKPYLVKPSGSGVIGGSNKESLPKECIKYSGTSNRRRGYTSLKLDSTRSKLFASCTDNTVYEYHLGNAVTLDTRQPIHKYTGHYSSSFYVRITLSPDDIFLLSGCDEEKAFIWKTIGQKQEEVLPSHSMTSSGMEQVTSVAWSPQDWTKIITCSDDCVVRLWKLPTSFPSTKQKDGYCERLAQSLNSGKQKEERSDCKHEQEIGLLETNATVTTPTQKIKFTLSDSGGKVVQSSLKKWVKYKESVKTVNGKTKAARQLNVEGAAPSIPVVIDKENLPNSTLTKTITSCHQSSFSPKRSVMESLQNNIPSYNNSGKKRNMRCDVISNKSPSRIEHYFSTKPKNV